MKTTRTFTGFSTWAGLVCAACGGASPAIDTPVDPMSPAAVDDHVVFVDRGRREARLIDVSKSTPPSAQTVIPLIRNPTKLEQRRGHSDELLVLSAGQSDDGSAPPEQPGLVVISASGKRREYRYDSAFNAISQSADGRFAFLYFDQSAGSRASTLLFNPNEVAIIDLTGTAAPHVRTLRSFGGSPHSVAFAQMKLNGADRQVAVVLFESDVAILDLDHLDRSEYTVGLTSGIHLAQVVFSSTEPKLYLRANDSNDIYVIRLADASAGANATGKNDFTPSVTQLGAGAGPSDMLLYSDKATVDTAPTERLLVAAQGSGQAVVIEPDTSNVTAIPLTAPASKVLFFDQPKPSDPNNTGPRALFFTPGGKTVAFMDLHDVQSRGALNVELLTVPQNYGSVLSLDANTVMLLHQGTGLSLLNLAQRTVAQIQGPNLLGASADPSAKVGKLWLATGDRLGFLDLTGNVHPNEVRVDATIQDRVPVPSATNPRLVVTHPSSTGWATVIDAMDPTNLHHAYSMRGFLLTGALDGDG